MKAKLMNGTYYEIVGGMEEDIIKKADATLENDSKAKIEAMNTERVAYRNTYENGKRIASERIYDPYNDGFFMVGEDTLYYEPLSRDKTFQYSMLGRLKTDCDYFLGCGYGFEGHLWAGTVEEQIREMRERWNSFEDDEKPEWLTMEQIDKYEIEMLRARENKKKGVIA